MIRNILLGAIIPAALVAVGLVFLFLVQAPIPGRKPPVPNQPAFLLAQMLSADVQQVRSLAEVSASLDIPVNGTVVPFREIELAAEAAGRITEKSAATRPGNMVKAGDVLYRIDPRDYDLQVERVQRRLDQERAALVEMQQEVENTERLLKVAEEEFKLAQDDVKRFESLAKNFRSQSELDTAKRSLLASMNQRVSVQNQMSTLRTRQVRLELAIKLAETELEQAKLDLERTVIRAPVSGRVVREQVEKDSYVQRGAPLVTIEDTSKVEVAANLRMDQLYWILDQHDVSTDNLVNAAQAARYELPQNDVKVRYELAGRESVLYEWDGTLARYDGAGIDPQSRTVPVLIEVQDPAKFRINGKPASESSMSGPASLVRGMFVDVIIEANPQTPLLLVPKLSVKPATGTNQIWKFTKNEAAFETIRNKLKATSKLAEDKPDKSKKIDLSEIASIEKPERWAVGFLTVIDGVEVIGPYQPSKDTEEESANKADEHAEQEAKIEYWICEVSGTDLAAGDSVVVTPLPGVEAEGDEPIRVLKSQLKN